MNNLFEEAHAREKKSAMEVMNLSSGSHGMAVF
jgi:hypothetical protein